MNFIQSIIDLAKSFWPVTLVEQWEKGVYYFFGRYWKVVGPGAWPILPWFSRIITVTTVPAPISTPRMDLTLSTGEVVSFAATAVIQVTDPATALNAIDNYKESTQEVLAAVLADRLARVKRERLEPENRASLLRALRKCVNEETKQFGVECRSVKFTTFVTNARTFRFLSDAAIAPWAS